MQDVIKSLSDEELRNVLRGLNVTDVRSVRNASRERVNKALGPRTAAGIGLVHFFFDLEDALVTPGDSLDIRVNDLNLYFVKGLGWFRASPGNRCAPLASKDAILPEVHKKLSNIKQNEVFISANISQEVPGLSKINQALLNLSDDLGLKYAPTRKSNHTYASDIQLQSPLMLTVHVHMEGDDLETFAYDIS
jgi:hypothetical protein